MRRHSGWGLALLLGLLLGLLVGCVGTSQRATVRVILDTDIDSDVDDVQAVAMAHTLADAGHFKLLGIVVTSDDPHAAAAVSVLNQHFGRPDLPIGVLKDQPLKRNHSRYTRRLAEEFPGKLKRDEEAQDATALYRRLLSRSPDQSVVIVTVGHLTNLQNLLRSGPDADSPLGGVDLVRKKVQRWICMGGQFPRGKEANFYRPDPLSTVTCVREWPGPVVFCGWELGNQIKTGGAELRDQLTPKSPVYRAYQLYNDFKGRASWDQVAVMLLAPEGERYFELVKGGHCYVAEDGSNEWRTDQVRDHAYVRLREGIEPNTVARHMDALSHPKGSGY